MMSPERDVEKGTAGRDITRISTDDAQQRKKPGSWDRFQPWPTSSTNAGEQPADKRDPRVIAQLQALVPATAVFDISPNLTNLAIGHRAKQEHEAWERVAECSDYEGEEYERAMEDFLAKHDAREITQLRGMWIQALPKSTRGALASAAAILEDYDPESQFSHGFNPNGARALFQQNEVHRFLRLLLDNRYIGPLLFWMREVAPGRFDIDSLDATVEVVEGIAIFFVLLVPFGLVLFRWATGMASEIFLFCVAAVGVLAIQMLERENKYLMVLGLMAVMASIVLGDRDNGSGLRTDT